MINVVLRTGWQFKHRDDAHPHAADFASAEGWLPAAVPGVTHLDLMRAGRIPDPFYGLNENEVQWVGHQDWLYRCTFDVTAEQLAHPHLTLCFDGLDTFAAIWLNGQPLLTTDNMFVPHRAPVTGRLRLGANELWLLFESAFRRGRALEAEHGRLPLWNGDSSRLYVRKAQYHYGWDWGPTLLTAGPWRPVRLEAYTARLAELHCQPEVAEDLRTARIAVTAAIEGEAADATVRFTLIGPDGAALAEAVTPAAAARHTFAVTAPALWWPNGHGAQPLYHVTATLEQGDAPLDQHTQRLGLRRLRLVQAPLDAEPGRTFLFEVNNTPLFCGGANWIPADSLLPRVTEDRYRRLLELAAAGHMVMLRVWGGGIYEDDLFYDLCDELGLLVWQDFMFACGLYPAHAAFAASVRAEAEANIRRLRHHPCLALWCGNNEDYQLANSLGLYTEAAAGPLPDARFPARALYEKLLPEVCAALDPGREYWPGSPFGGANANSQVVGDRHTWDVWHGQTAAYPAYPRFEGRFVSEFGMMSLPARATLEAAIPPEERHPFSRALNHHNKATDGLRRLCIYLSDILPVTQDLEDFLYGTQLMQAEALAAAYRGWRRRWAGPGRYAVAGALVWQINDCWPVSSWAIIDSDLRAKPAYYVIRRALAPLSLGLARGEAGRISAWAVNQTPAPVTATLHLTAWTLAGERRGEQSVTVTLAPQRAAELEGVTLTAATDEVVGARLVVADQTAARAALWPEPFKAYEYPDPGLALHVAAGAVQVRATRPAKGVWLEAGADVSWDDNLLDILPDDPQTVHLNGQGAGQVRARALGGRAEA